MIFKLENVYLKDSIVLGSKLEGEGPVGKYLDKVCNYTDSTFENLEINMLSQAIDMLKEKLNYKDSNIDLAIGGELSNQLGISSYSLRKNEISLIGIYSACSTISLAIGLAGLLLSRNDINNILVFTSANNQCAERQFRNPIEYGGEKEDTQTFTSTISACALITSDFSEIKITNFTLGKIMDIGFSDQYDFGRAMAPAAIESLFEHFNGFNTKPSDYDLILTGDLSLYGYEIVKKELIKKYGNVENYNDCGLMLYKKTCKKVLAGASGPATSAGVLLSYVKHMLLNKTYKRVLLCATGALMNTTMINQKNSLPCIAHVIELERSV